MQSLTAVGFDWSLSMQANSVLSIVTIYKFTEAASNQHPHLHAQVCHHPKWLQGSTPAEKPQLSSCTNQAYHNSHNALSQSGKRATKDSMREPTLALLAGNQQPAAGLPTAHPHAHC